MAEYNMTYEEVSEFIEECIQKSENITELDKHRAEILAALTVSEDDVQTSVKETIELWENQIGTPSELLLGTRYIRIKDSMIAFIQIAFTSGLVDAFIANPVDPIKNMALTGAAISGVVFSLISLFTSASHLNDDDFCIYLQAVTHFRAHKEFTLDDLMGWFPQANDNVCNMHNSKWDCEYLDENGLCTIMSENKINDALKSLCEKKLLKKSKINGVYTYTFAL